jgi:hypothetical protein
MTTVQLDVRDYLRLARVLLPAGVWQTGWLKNKPLPPHRVMMFHFGRSGSTVLADLLDQHPDITWQGEYIRKFYAPVDRKRLQRLQLPADPGRLLLDVMAGVTRPYFGCETKFFHLGQLRVMLPAYLDCLERMDFSYYIVLQRKNYIRKIVSSLVAQKRRRYRQAPDSPAELIRINLRPERVKIDRTELPLLTLLDNYARSFEQLNRLLEGHSPLQLTYEEDLLAAPAIGYERACAYLGLRPAPVQVNYGRSNPFPLRAILKNYDEVASALKGTSYAWMMTDTTGDSME